MDMEGALRARLLAAAPVTALVAQRIYWEDRPQGASLPAVVLEMVTDLRDQHMSGFQSLFFVRVQVWAMALTFAAKKQLKEAVIAALAPAQVANGVSFDEATSIIATPRNERVETQMIFADLIELTFHYRPI